MNQGKRAFHAGTGAALLLVLTSMAAQAGQPAFRTKFSRRLVKEQPVLICTRVKQPPKIDGEVDKDPAWRSCNRTSSAWVELGTKKRYQDFKGSI